jgi:hypothetical protein
MIERRVRCHSCRQPTDLLIDATGQREVHGWTCRLCGHVNRIRVPGQIACNAADALEPSAEELRPAAVERREERRVPLTSAQLYGQQVGERDTFQVDEASPSGFSIRGRRTYHPGVSYRFRLWATPGQATIVAAVCRHCKLVAIDDSTWTYRAGFQFLPQSARRLRTIFRVVAANAT